MYGLWCLSLCLSFTRKRDTVNACVDSTLNLSIMTSEKLRLEDLINNEPLPEILQAEWARDQVLQLFADLRAGAEVQQVQLRSTTAEAAVTLEAAQAAFTADQAQAIQVRYIFEGEVWCDTILPGNPTTKIIRNRLASKEPIKFDCD
jgi:hypothetical protein